METQIEQSSAGSPVPVPCANPPVTIIMPIRNEARFIEKSLGAALSQDYPPECLEVIVVDGMSSDGTRALVKAKSAKHSNLRLIENPGLTVSKALNLAVPQVSGEIIIWVGGHTEIARDYVSRCAGYLRSGEYQCVGGPMDTISPTLSGQTVALVMSSPFGVGGAGFRMQQKRQMEVDTVAFGAYLRSAMERCGPLDEELVRNQDDEYNYRLRDLGGRILLAPDIRSRYYSRSSIRSLWHQYFQYGYWKVRVMQKHTRQMQARHFAPPLFAAALFGTLLLVPFSRVGRLLLGLIVAMYSLANMLASLLTAGKHGWHHLFLLPATFATLHLSYGTGFLLGLIRFWNRWSNN